MKHALLCSVVLSLLVVSYTCFANSTLPAEASTARHHDESDTPTQLQIGTLPPIDVGVAVSGSSHKFMRFDRIANKLQRAGQSIENGTDAQQAARDARLNNQVRQYDADPVRAPSEGKADQQGHKALGVALQTNF